MVRRAPARRGRRAHLHPGRRARSIVLADDAAVKELQAEIRDELAFLEQGSDAMLAAARASLERWLLGFAAMVQVLMVMPAVGWFYDDRYLTISLAYVLASVLLTAVFARRPARSRPTPTRHRAAARRGRQTACPARLPRLPVPRRSASAAPPGCRRETPCCGRCA